MLLLPSLKIKNNIRTGITHHELEETFSFDDSDEEDILLSREQAQIPRHLREEKTEEKRMQIRLPFENL